MRLEAPTEELYTGGGAMRGNVRQMSSIQARTASSDQCAVLRGLKNAHHPPCFSPYFLVNPRLLCPGSPHCRAPLGFASAWISSDFPCQLVCWCFLLYFHLAPFCRAYQGLLTGLAVRYVYLAETCSHHCSGRSQPACLTRPWILWHHSLFALSFEGSRD